VRDRADLDALLRDILSGKISNFYFAPPSNIKISYPCVIYYKEGADHIQADDRKYISTMRYNLSIISKSSDFNTSCTELLLEKLPMCRLSNCYVSDNLYHDALTVYF